MRKIVICYLDGLRQLVLSVFVMKTLVVLTLMADGLEVVVDYLLTSYVVALYQHLRRDPR